MYKTIHYCENFLDYWEEIMGFYLIPGLLFVWIMASLASRNPKTQVQVNEPKARFFKQCLWILIAMFGGVFAIEKSLYEEFKRHRIVQKAIAVWLMVVGAAIVFLDGVNPLDRNAYETVVANNTMEIYSGDTQLRAFPSYDIYSILSKIRTFFLNFGIAMYIWCFRRSGTSIWFKIRKIAGICLLYSASIALAVTYTPFDLMMFCIVLLLAILLLIDYRGKEKKEKDLQKKKDSSFQIRPWTNLKNIIKKWELAIQSGIRHLRMKRMKSNVQKEGNNHIKIQQELVTATPIDKQTDITTNHEKTKSIILRKVQRYIVLALIAIGIITGVIWGIIYLVEDYIPVKKLDKAVNEIIYNFENSDKDTKRNYAKWILSIQHEWGYEDVYNSSIEFEILNKGYREKAFAYVESMAYKGDADCQYLLGSFYLFGTKRGEDAYNVKELYYTKQDLDKSNYWYNEAALQDHPKACNNLGIAYKEGRGNLRANYAKAAYWLKKSAELGEAYGQVNYGDLWQEGFYLDGNFVRDIEIAKSWWRKAAQQGDERAKDRLQTLYE